MSDAPIDRKISLAPAETPVTVTVAGREVARSDRAVVLDEEGYAPVRYIPRSDVRMDLLSPSGTRTHCPYKGDATYFAMDGRDVAWSYEDPKPGVGGIAGHLAFDPRVAEIEG